MSAMNGSTLAPMPAWRRRVRASVAHLFAALVADVEAWRRAQLAQRLAAPPR